MDLSLTVLVCLFAFAGAAPGTAPAKPAKTNPKVTLDTSKGKIVIELYPDKAPKTVENFLAYVRSGTYNGTIFHRVIPGFMVQGGGYDANGEQRPTRAPIQNESDNGLANERGTVAMARTNDPNSATDQFFINVKDNAFLNRGAQGAGYAVFGKVTEGMDVADKIVAVPRGRGSIGDDQPNEAVVLNKAVVSSK
jgi:peptidyl-prolyl cis-trans isomerase B (cyclophilin B)